jgi:hypothetical protein
MSGKWEDGSYILVSCRGSKECNKLFKPSCTFYILMFIVVITIFYLERYLGIFV